MRSNRKQTRISRICWDKPWHRPREIVLDTDGVDENIGTVLSQIQDGQENVIAFRSKMLTKTESNYYITRHGLLAFVHFVS